MCMPELCVVRLLQEAERLWDHRRCLIFATIHLYLETSAMEASEISQIACNSSTSSRAFPR